MISDTDVVSLKWVTDLLNAQAESAEQALVDYSNAPTEKRHLLLCMWSAHQITSTLRMLGMKKGQMLTLEVERCLNYLYRDQVKGEHRKLAMGALMQALKVFPAYLSYAQTSRSDSGQGLEPHVNDLRRWLGVPPRPQAFFFNFELPAGAGITAGAHPDSDEEIKKRANVMLALYLKMAKSGLRRRNTRDSMKTVARIARKMQTLFAGSEPERFWMTMIGLCEGLAGGLMLPDECIAQIFKAGAFLIKHARESGAQIDTNVDYDTYLQQMLYYIAACKARPVHIKAIRNTFGIDSSTLETATQGLIHIDALITALTSALSHLNIAEEYITHHGLDISSADNPVSEALEAAQYRLEAAGKFDHADTLADLQNTLNDLVSGKYNNDSAKLATASDDIVKAIVDIKLDVEHKINHGLNSSFSAREFELRESVVNATFAQMGMMENHLQTMLRRQALSGALQKPPTDEQSRFALIMAVNRYLNKSDQGHEALRKVVKKASTGKCDDEQLYSLSQELLQQQQDLSDEATIEKSAQLLLEISGALHFSGMSDEATIVDQCHDWLISNGQSGKLVEDAQFQLFAQAFAHIEMHLQRSLIDPLGDTQAILAAAQRCANELTPATLGTVAEAPLTIESTPEPAEPDIEDAEASAEFREAFIEEAEELSTHIKATIPNWLNNPHDTALCTELRRYFHTLKGSGRAVGANILGELGCAAQDLFDAIIERQLDPEDKAFQALIQDTANALPGLISGYSQEQDTYKAQARQLTQHCRQQLGSNDVSTLMTNNPDGELTPPGPSQ